jgi:hypothetical protein
VSELPSTGGELPEGSSSRSTASIAQSHSLLIPPAKIVGYGVLQMFVHIPVVFFLCWLFAHHIPYIPPMK